MSTAHTSVPEVLDALKDVSYPADKERLVTAARAAGASEEVVKALGLKKGAAVDPQKDERMVCKLFRYTTHTLGVNPPDLFLRPESKDPLQVANIGVSIR